MLLSPQHFQQEALRGQLTTAAHLSLARPFHWGVVHLLLDRVALISGVVRVLELEALMPDGLLVWHDQTSPAPLELDISPMADPLSQAPFTIHLTVPAARSGTWGGEQRWISTEGRPVADENGGEEIAIPRLHPRLGLTVTTTAGDRPPQRFVSMPIARVVFANDSFAMADFAPPALAVAPNATLGRICAEVVRRLREKAMLLSERAAGGEDGGWSADEARSLVAGLPPLEAQLAAEVCHPFDVYLAMCGLVGHVSAFAKGGVPPKLSRYDHNDPLPAFVEIRDYLVKVIERIHDVAVPLHFTFEDGMFGLEIQPDWLKHRLVIGVRGPAAMSASEAVGWIDNAVIASRSKLEHLSALRVKGAERFVIENDAEAGITPQRGTVLFSIERDPELILPGERLEIWNPDNLGSRYRPADIVLFVVT